MKRLSRRGATWLIAYFAILCFIIVQYIAIKSPSVLDSRMIYDLFESRQKLLFNNTIFFSVFLYIFRIDFLNPELIVRYRSRLFTAIIKNGVLSSLIYSLYSYSILLLIVFVLKINIGINLFVPILKLFVFCMYLFLVYTILYFKFANQIIALTSNVVVNTLALVSSIGIMYARGTSEGSTGIHGSDMRWFVLAAVNVGITALVYFLVKKREYLK